MPQPVNVRKASAYIERPGDDSTTFYTTDYDEVPAPFGLKSSALGEASLVNGAREYEDDDAPLRRRSESWKMKQRGQLDASSMSETRAVEWRRVTFAHRLGRTGQIFLGRQCHDPCRPKYLALAV